MLVFSSADPASSPTAAGWWCPRTPGSRGNSRPERDWLQCPWQSRCSLCSSGHDGDRPDGSTTGAKDCHQAGVTDCSQASLWCMTPGNGSIGPRSPRPKAEGYDRTGWRAGMASPIAKPVQPSVTGWGQPHQHTAGWGHTPPPPALHGGATPHRPVFGPPRPPASIAELYRGEAEMNPLVRSHPQSTQHSSSSSNLIKDLSKLEPFDGTQESFKSFETNLERVAAVNESRAHSGSRLFWFGSFQRERTTRSCTFFLEKAVKGNALAYSHFKKAPKHRTATRRTLRYGMLLCFRPKQLEQSFAYETHQLSHRPGGTRVGLLFASPGTV